MRACNERGMYPSGLSHPTHTRTYVHSNKKKKQPPLLELLVPEGEKAGAGHRRFLRGGRRQVCFAWLLDIGLKRWVIDVNGSRWIDRQTIRRLWHTLRRLYNAWKASIFSPHFYLPKKQHTWTPRPCISSSPTPAAPFCCTRPPRYVYVCINECVWDGWIGGWVDG